MIDILNIQPNVISRDLRGKYVLLYGNPKSGKTTAAASFPKALLCAFEKGYNAIGGVIAADITKWTEFKQIINQLKTPEAQSKYDTIIIDTISIAWEMCEKYVCTQAGEQKISDIAWGQGYDTLKREFASALRTITQLGYGIVLIAHSGSRTEKVNNQETVYYYPDMPKRATEICNGLVDIIGYIGEEFDENYVSHRYLYTRPTPNIYAGSRYKYLAPKIPFGYEELTKALDEAIQMSEKIDGAVVVDKTLSKEIEVLDFNLIMNQLKDLWKTLVTDASEEEKEINAQTILKKAEIIFNRRMKLSEITEDQVDLANLLLSEIQDFANTLK